jgi:hypothetical protein
MSSGQSVHGRGSLMQQLLYGVGHRDAIVGSLFNVNGPRSQRCVAVQSLLTADLAQMPPMQILPDADWPPRTRQPSLIEVDAHQIRTPTFKGPWTPIYFFYNLYHIQRITQSSCERFGCARNIVAFLLAASSQLVHLLTRDYLGTRLHYALQNTLPTIRWPSAHSPTTTSFRSPVTAS